MSKNIRLLGQDYLNVPGVNLPQTNGGLAYFADVTDTTATASDVVSGKTFYTANGTKTTGTGTNDFIITLSKNNSTGVWTPDCTFAEALAAYNGGKNIVFVTDTGTACTGVYEDGAFYYGVDEGFSLSANEYGFYGNAYVWNSTGISDDGSEPYYSVFNATATPSDVAAGKIFYNGSGYQVGTAGGASAISVVDTVDSNGGIIRTITAVDLSNDTVTASKLLQGYTAHDRLGNAITGTATTTGGNDFIITLTKNASTGIWEPDCTYAEAQAAYDGGKNIAFEASLSGSPIPCGEDSRTSNKIKYFVFEPVVTSNDFVFNYNDYTWDSVGINAQNPYPYYDTNSATAVPADVASGKVFYNANGRQTGTASNSSDFVVTLSYNDTSAMYEPDCTFAEARAALDEGKNVVFTQLYGAFDCRGFEVTSTKFVYYVFEYKDNGNFSYEDYLIYEWTSTGISGRVINKYYDTTSATAIAQDVASGKTFFNGSGYQTGTATAQTSTLVTKNITANGTYNASSDNADGYSQVTVSVAAPTPSLQTKSISPSESSQTVIADSGYDGLSSVSVGAISSTYVGSGVDRRSSTNLTVSGATVTAPAGYYAEAATKSVASGSASTPATTITANPTISVSSSGLITANVSGSKSITPTVSAGYVSSGTAGTVSVSGSNTQQLTTKAATTIYPSTTDQTIASGTYLTGTQTIKAVTVSGLSAGNIASGVTVKVGDSADDDRITSVTGTLSFVTYYTGSSAPSSQTGSDGDIYLKVVT